MTPPADLNGLVRFGRKTESGFCACAITFQTHYTSFVYYPFIAFFSGTLCVLLLV